MSMKRARTATIALPFLLLLLFGSAEGVRLSDSFAWRLARAASAVERCMLALNKRVSSKSDTAESTGFNWFNWINWKRCSWRRLNYLIIKRVPTMWYQHKCWYTIFGTPITFFSASSRLLFNEVRWTHRTLYRYSELWWQETFLWCVYVCVCKLKRPRKCTFYGAKQSLGANCCSFE